MNTNTMEMNMNEMEQVSGGGIGDYLSALKDGFGRMLCYEMDSHDYEWNGDWSMFTMDGVRYKSRLFICSRCGKTKRSIGYSPVED